MALFARRNDNPQLAGLREFIGREPHVLGLGTGPRVVVVALPQCLCWRLGQEPWRRVEWHLVRVGGWNQEGSEMWWRLSDGTGERLVLDEEGTFPSAFRDRVQASIAFQRRVALQGRQEVLISARKSLDGQADGLVWDVMPLGGAKLDDPATRAQVDAALAELRADYDI